MGDPDGVSTTQLHEHPLLSRHYRTTAFGLVNGGTAGAIYIYIFTFIGFGLAVISMAEMASMYPSYSAIVTRRN